MKSQQAPTLTHNNHKINNIPQPLPQQSNTKVTKTPVVRLSPT